MAAIIAHAAPAVKHPAASNLRFTYEEANVCAPRLAATIQVVESRPSQNVARLLLQMDADPDRIREYVTALDRLMLPAWPVLLCVEHPDVVLALREAAAQHGPAWTACAVDLTTGCPCAPARTGRDRGSRMVRLHAV